MKMLHRYFTLGVALGFIGNAHSMNELPREILVSEGSSSTSTDNSVVLDDQIAPRTLDWLVPGIMGRLKLPISPEFLIENNIGTVVVNSSVEFNFFKKNLGAHGIQIVDLSMLQLSDAVEALVVLSAKMQTLKKGQAIAFIGCFGMGNIIGGWLIAHMYELLNDFDLIKYITQIMRPFYEVVHVSLLQTICEDLNFLNMIKDHRDPAITEHIKNMVHTERHIASLRRQPINPMQLPSMVGTAARTPQQSQEPQNTRAIYTWGCCCCQ